MSSEFAVIDFETTGMNPGYCRVIEVAAVIIRDGVVLDSFVQLMHPGKRLPFFISELTGITDEMLEGKPGPEYIMPELLDFLGDRPCIAHNAVFDSRFYHAEMERAGIPHERQFLCTMKLSRRLIQDSPNHRLETLARHLNLPSPAAGGYHRALYDAMLTAALWRQIENIVERKLGGRAPALEIYGTLMKTPKAKVQKYLDKLSNEYCRATQIEKALVEEKTNLS